MFVFVKTCLTRLTFERPQCFGKYMGNSGPLYYGDENLVSVIDQVVQFKALFAMWFPHFWYHRWIRALVFE